MIIALGCGGGAFDAGDVKGGGHRGTVVVQHASVRDIVFVTA
jgi:hypothetical protein